MLNNANLMLFRRLLGLSRNTYVRTLSVPAKYRLRRVVASSLSMLLFSTAVIRLDVRDIQFTLRMLHAAVELS